MKDEKPAYTVADLKALFDIGHSHLWVMFKAGLRRCHLYPGSKKYLILREDLLNHLIQHSTKETVPEVPKL